MRREEISRALSMLNEEYILEALELTEPGSEAPKGNDMKNSRRSARNLRRTLLIAAVISVFFAVTAFAIGYGINRQRQQELREQLQIDQHQVEEYTEYPLPEETGDEVSTQGEMTVTLLSSISGVQFDKVYFNVSPMEPVSARDVYYFFGVSHDGGETYISMDAMWINGQQVYDEETKTATFEYLISHTGSDQASRNIIVGYCPDARDEEAEMQQLGSFTLDLPEVRIRTCMFENPIEFSCEELGKTGRLLGVELYSGGMTWLLEHEDSERFYHRLRFEDLSQEEQEWIHSVSAPWANTISAVTMGSLHMADGSDIEPRSAESGAYQDGIVKRYSSFALSTIDPDDVISITLFDGTTIDLS